MATRKIMNPTIVCSVCGKRKSEKLFYSAGRFKAGFFHACKNCLQMRSKHNNFEYVLDVLKQMDRPMLRSIWNKIYYKYGDTCFGHYLATVIGNPKYNELGFEDSILEEVSAETDLLEESIFNDMWRGTFTIPDLNYLEQYYEELHRDYKITTTNHKDYAKKIAKASLAMDKAYERMLNDRDEKAAKEFKELKGIFDDLCKSAQFSESTRSANDVGLGSFGVIFNMIENNEWIPQHKPLKKDLYDKLLDQFANISKSL
jgi:hypothetical protein